MKGSICLANYLWEYTRVSIDIFHVFSKQIRLECTPAGFKCLTENMKHITRYYSGKVEETRKINRNHFMGLEKKITPVLEKQPAFYIQRVGAFYLPFQFFPHL